MRTIRIVLSTAVIALGLACAAPAAHAQIAVGVNIGPQPVCPYGYYDYAPYNCAPYGYYGPEWFPNGIFIGAGPWWHGHDHWYGRYYGHVDHRYDPRFGYHGGFPARGEHPIPHGEGFHGTGRIDGRGHYRGHH